MVQKKIQKMINSWSTKVKFCNKTIFQFICLNSKNVLVVISTKKNKRTNIKLDYCLFDFILHLCSKTDRKKIG